MADARYVIDIILNARNDTARAFAEATGNAEAFEQAMRDSERSASESMDRLDKSTQKTAKSLTRLKEEGQSIKGTLAQDILHAERQTEKYRKKLDEARLAQAGLNKESQKFQQAEKDINKATAATAKWANEAKRLRDLLNNDERANQLDNQIVTVQRLSQQLARMRADEKTRTEQLLVVEKQLNAEARNLIRLRNEEGALSEREIGRQATELRNGELRVYQEREIQQIRERGERLSRGIATTDDVAAIVRMRRELDGLRNSLERLGTEEKQRGEIALEWGAIEQVIVAQRVAAEQERDIMVQRREAERQYNNEIRRRTQLEREYGAARSAAAKAGVTAQDAKAAGLTGVERVAVEAQFENLAATAREAHSRLQAEFPDVEVNVDADIGGAIADAVALRAAMQAIKDEGSGAGDIGFFATFQQALEDSGNRISTFDNQIRGAFTLAIGVGVQPLATALVGLAGQFFATASSAIYAGGAIGGSMTAAASQAVPALGVIALGLARIKAVSDVVGQANLVDQQKFQRAQTQGKKLADTADQVRNAQDSLESATDRVGDAHERVAEAQERLTEARQQARREIEDLILAEREAELAARGAALSQEESQERIRQALSQGRTGDLARADLDVDSADVGIDRAAQRLARLRADVQDAAGDPENMPRVRAAKRALEQAKEGVADAEASVDRARRGLERARRGTDAAAEDSFAAAAKLEYLRSQLSDTENDLLGTFTRIYTLYQDPNGPIRGISDALLEGVDGVAEGVARLMQDTRITGALEDLAGSMGTGLEDLFNTIFEDEGSREQWVRFIDAATANVPVLVDILENLYEWFEMVADVATPLFGDLLKGTEEWTGELGRSKATREEVADFLREASTHLGAWLALGGAVAELFMALAGAGGADSGLDSIQALTDKVREATEWVRENQEAVRDFFEDTERIAAAVGNLILAIGQGLLDIMDVGTVEAFAEVIEDMLIPALVDAFDAIGTIIKAFNDLSNVPGVGWVIDLLVQWGIAAAVTTTILLKLRTFFNPFIAVLALAARRLGLIGDGVGKVAGTAGKVGILTGAFAKLNGAVGGVLSKVGSLIGKLPGLGRVGAVIAGMGAGVLGGRGAGGGVDIDRGPGGRVMRGVQRVFVVNFPPGMGGPGGGGSDVYAGGGGDGPDRDGRPRGRLGRFADRLRGSRVGRLAGGVAGRLGRFGTPLAIAGSIGASYLGSRIGGVAGGTIGGAATGAGIGATAGLIGGPLAPITSGIGAAAGATIGGAIGFFTSRSAQKKIDEAKDKVKEFSKQLNALKTTKSAEEFNKLADKLKKFAKDAPPEVRKELQKVIDKANSMGSELRKSLRLDDLVFQFGVKLNLDRKDKSKMKEDLNGFLKTLFDTEKDPAARRAGVRKMKELISGLRSQGKISEQTADELKGALDKKFDEMATNSRRANARAVRRQLEAANALLSTFAAANAAIVRQVNTVLNAFGVERVRLPKTQADVKQLGRDAGQIAGVVGSILGGGRAGGGEVEGFVGNQGERGADSLRNTVGGVPVGRGEAVVANWGQQRYINEALHARFGWGLPDLFKRVRGRHAEGGPGGYAGGYAGKTPHGRMVPIPGQRGEFVNAKIVDDVVKMMRRFKMAVTDGFATTGHAPGGDHPKGMGVDFVPGRGGNWDLVDRAAAYARSKMGSVFRWIGYDGVPNHGRGHHLHLSWGGGGSVGALAAALKKIKTPEVRGSGPTRDLVATALSRVTRQANRYLREKTAESEDSGPGGYESHPTGKGVLSAGRVRSVISRAMELVGVPESLRQRWSSMAYRRARQESGFNPNIQNNWDSNAAAGTPSIGLFQTIGPTFSAYDMPGMNNIRNPLHNAVAAFRYMLARYGKGSWGRALQGMLGREGVGYRFGGEIPGFGGGDQHVIRAEGGEHMWTKEEVASAGGHGMVRALRKMFGRGGQSQTPGAYKEGGAITVGDVRNMTSVARLIQLEVRRGHELGAKVLQAIGSRITALLDRAGASTERRRVTDARRGNYRLPEFSPQNSGDVEDEIKIYNTAFRAIHRKSKDYFARINRLLAVATREGGLLDIARDAISRDIEDKATSRIAGGRGQRNEGRGALYRLGGTFAAAGGRVRRVIQRQNPVTQAEIAVKDANTALDLLREHENDIFTELRRTRRNIKRVQDRMRQLRRSGGRVDKKEREEYDDLTKDLRDARANERNLTDRARTINKDIADAIADAAQKQADLFQKETEGKLRPLNLSNTFIDFMSSMAQRTGNVSGPGGVVDLGQQRLNNLREQAKITEQRALEAERLGMSDYSDQLREQLVGLWGQIAQEQDRLTEVAMEAVSAEAQRAEARIAVGERISGARGRLMRGAGGRVAIALGAEEANRQRGANLSTQRAGLQAILGYQMSLGAGDRNQNLIDQLNDQIADLGASIEENTASQMELTEATRNARLATITERAEFGTSIYGTLNSIVTSMAPDGRNLAEEQQNLQGAGAFLSTAGGGLRQQLAEFGGTFGIGGLDLRGQSGQGFVDSIQAILQRTDSIMSSLTDEQANSFRSLINQLVANEAAVQENNKQLKDLNPNNNAQGFSSSAWQWMRTAITNGVGDLMPQYNIPAMATGGYITKAGIFDLHPGEFVINADRSNMPPVQDGPIYINVDKTDGYIDEEILAQKLAFRRSVARANR